MKRLEIVVRPSALKDIRDIYDWIAVSSTNPVIADRFVKRIFDACFRIGDMPNGGRPRDDLLMGLRTVGFEREAIIAYVVRNERVEITNVFYGGRDYEAVYRDAGLPIVSD